MEKIMIHKFVICGVARVGSNYFVNLLNHHSQILCHYEIFHPRGLFFGFEDKGMAADHFKEKWDIRRRDREPLEFLAQLWDIHQGQEAIGYNIFPGQNKPALRESLRDVEQKKILLRRKDLLKSFVSRGLAQKTGVWVCQRRGIPKATRNTKIRFLPDDFLSYLLRVFNFYNHLETVLGVTKQNYLTVYYEDLIQEREATLKKTFDFLSVRQETLEKRSKYLKQNPEELELLVENYEDMKDFLSGYDFENFFHSSNKPADLVHTLKKKILQSLTGR
jgi:LPS sulfotransferase NodH